MKRKVLASLLLIAVVAGLVGASTWAWFSDSEKTVDNVFTTGTLNMTISDSDEGPFDGQPVHATWQSPSGWAPGDCFESEVTLHNIGSIDIPYMAIFWENPGGFPELGNVIEVYKLEEYIYGCGWYSSLGPPQNYELKVNDYAAPLTLNELIVSYWEGDTSETDAVSGSTYDVCDYPALQVGQVYKQRLGFCFMTSAGNEYQGKTMTFDIKFEGWQDLSQVY